MTTTPRRPKLAALPDVMTAPPMQLLAHALRQKLRLSFEALGQRLGIDEHSATTLCRSGWTPTPAHHVYAHLVGAMAAHFDVSFASLENWIATPPHGRRGLAVTDLVQQALDGDDNELTKLHRAAIQSSMTTQAFAASLGLSRQRLWVLEREGSGEGYDRAVARAKGVVG